MAKVLSEQELGEAMMSWVEAQRNSKELAEPEDMELSVYALENVDNLFATIQTKDEEINSWRRVAENLQMEIEEKDATIQAKDEIIASSFKEFETLYDAARDFLQAYRAMKIGDANHPCPVSNFRDVQEAAKRLASLLGEGETQP